MSAPDDRSTRVLPAATGAPAPAPPARFWRQKMPARIGRARTSTVVLSVLFLVFFGLYLGVRPAVQYTTVETTTGQTVRVPVSQLDRPAEPGAPAGPAAPTTEVPAPGTPADTPTPVPTSPAAPTTPRSTAPTGPDGTGATTRPAPATTGTPSSTPRSTGGARTPATSGAPEEPAETSPAG